MTDDAKLKMKKKQSPFIKLLTKFETSEEEVRKLHSVQLRLASPRKIKQWSERKLPSGEIIGSLTNAQTVNYKTLKPEKGGLFCERIFGPVKDYSCSCGKQATKKNPKICPDCGVQFISSRSRRYKMGYIKLVSPVTHIWYLKNSPSSLSLVLNLKKKRLEAITYCSETFSSNVKSFKNELNFQNIWPLLKKNPVSLEQGLKQKINPFFFNEHWINFVLGSSYLRKTRKKKAVLSQHRNELINNYQKVFKKNLNDCFLQKRHRGGSSLNDQFQPLSFLNADYELRYAKTNFLVFGGSKKAKGFHKPFKINCSVEQSNFLIWFDLFPSFWPIRFSFSKQKELKALSQAFQDEKFFFASNLHSFSSNDGYLARETRQLKEKKNVNLISLNSFKKDFFCQEIRAGEPLVKIQIKSFSSFFFSSSSEKEVSSKVYLRNEQKKNKVNPFYQERPLGDLIKDRTKKTFLKNPLGNVNFRRYLTLKLTFPLKRALLLAQIKDYKKFSFTSKIIKVCLDEPSFKKRILFRKKNELKTRFSNDFAQKQRLKRMVETVFGTFSSRSYKKAKIYLLNESLPKFLLKLPVFYDSGSQVLNLHCFAGFQSFLDERLEKLPLENQRFKKKKALFFVLIFFQKLKQKKNLYSNNQLIGKSFCSPFWLNGENFNKKKVNLTFDKWNSKKKVLKKALLFQLNTSALNFRLPDQSFPCKKETLFFFSKASLSLINDSKNTNWDKKTLAFFIDELEKKGTVRKPILLNNYYTIPQSFQWKFQKDWKGFLKYMTGIAEKEDSLIPCYLDRGVSFDLLLTGAGAIKNFLSLFTTNKTASIGSIELLSTNIQGTIRQLNQDIAKYDEFLKYFSIVSDEENEDDQEFLQQLFMKLVNLRSLRVKALRRSKILRPFCNKSVLPEWMVLAVLPVLPPSLRPILPLDDQQIAVSDLNKLYQTVLFRNKRVKRFYRDYYSLNFSEEMRYAQRLLQEAVDALIENGKGNSTPITASNNRPLKSLSDMIKGKKGRFRQNLLGKRVDYSGRSVIVVGPQLKLHECGLPQEMAIELFQPFLIRRLIFKKVTRNFISAKKLIKSNPNSLLDILREVMENRPILLNRAPTLHRLGIQAFQPKLVLGRAILLHPLVCNAFNADFDGDQMAVHIPLSFNACAEAWKLMGARNNILSPATGEPTILPSQDMVLGCYYLTTFDQVKTKKRLNQSSSLFPSINWNQQTNRTSYPDKNYVFRQSAFIYPSVKFGSLVNEKTDKLGKNEIQILRQKPLSFIGTQGFNLVVNRQKNHFEKNQSGKNFNSREDAFLFPLGSKKTEFDSFLTESIKTGFAINKSENVTISHDSNKYYSNLNFVLQSLNQQLIDLHTPIWLKWDSDFEFAVKRETFLETRLDKFGNSLFINKNYQHVFNFEFQFKTSCFYLRTTAGRVLMNQLILEIVNQPTLKKRNERV